MEPQPAFDEFARSLIGMPISFIWRGYGSAMFMELGELTPTTRRDGSPGHPEGEVSLGVEWSWRIQDGTSILCGSWSEEELWEGSLDKLRGEHVERCSLFGSLPEVEVAATSGVSFLSFSTIDGQPQWHLIDRRNGPARWFSVRNGRLHLGDGSEPVE